VLKHFDFVVGVVGLATLVYLSGSMDALKSGAVRRSWKRFWFAFTDWPLWKKALFVFGFISWLLGGMFVFYYLFIRGGRDPFMVFPNGVVSLQEMDRKLHQERHKTIVISNVPPQLFLKNLNKAFSAVGTVKFLTVKQGRAEVTFGSAAEATKAVKSFNTFANDIEVGVRDGHSRSAHIWWFEKGHRLKKLPIYCGMEEYDVSTDPAMAEEQGKEFLPVRRGEIFFGVNDETESTEKEFWIWLKNRRGEVGWVPKALLRTGYPKVRDPVLQLIPEPPWVDAVAPVAILCDIFNGGDLTGRKIKVQMK